MKTFYNFYLLSSCPFVPKATVWQSWLPCLMPLIPEPGEQSVSLRSLVEVLFYLFWLNLLLVVVK